jgi:hypothetical protein
MGRKSKESTAIKDFVSVLCPTPAVIELRALNTHKGTRSGYYNDVDKLVEDAVRAQLEAAGVYITVNPCSPALLARSVNHLTDYSKNTTADADIVERDWFPVDLDPVRPAGISSTDPEHHAALARAEEVKKYLSKEGWPEPIKADSGNGSYLLYRIALPNDPTSRELLKQCLQSLDLLFSDHEVKIDRTMFNAARIVRLFGTINRKGDPTDDRPHRRSHLLYVPTQISIVSPDLLAKLAAVQPQKPKSKRKSQTNQINVEMWIKDHDLELEKTKEWETATVYILKSCPFNPDHRSSAVMQFPDGGVVFKCFHDSCQPHGWKELQQLLDPHGTTNNSQPMLAYEETPEGIVYHRLVKGGTVPIQLSNFTARIVADVVRDDGAETRHCFEIETKLGDRCSSITVPSYRFSSLSWPAECLGARAIISPGVSNKDHLRAGIQHLSPSIQSRHIYEHTGWRKLESGIWGFLHGTGAIGPDGPLSHIETALPPPLARFSLPSPDSAQVIRGIRASLKLLEVAPASIVVGLYASIWRAPLGQTPFSNFIVGNTGVFKTELAALLQQHYGREMDAQHLPGSWMSTPNALEVLCFGAKDSLVVIDDFSPTGSSIDIQRCHANADRIFRAQGNHSGRDRLKADGTARPAKIPRGLILSTGEDIPMGASLRARLHISEVGPRDVDVKKLTLCQMDAAQGLYADAMSGYLRWIAQQYEPLHQTLQGDIDVLRQKAMTAQMHRRTPNTVANLAIGLQCFLRFVREYGVSEMETSELWDRGWTALRLAARTQYQHQAASDPVRRFFDLLRGAIVAGKAHLASLDGNKPLEKAESLGWRFSEATQCPDWRPQGDRIGWVDGSFVFLQPEASFAAAQKLGRDVGDSLCITRGTLGKRLKERKLLLMEPSRKDRITLRKVIEGMRREVIGLRLDTLLCAEPDQPDQTDQSDRTPPFPQEVRPNTEDALVAAGEPSSGTRKDVIDLDS